MAPKEKSERGCGHRQPGGIYLECGSESGGLPMSAIIADPVHPVDFEAMGVTPIGQHVVRDGDVVHLADVVGATHYPNAADFLMEACMMGISRRIARTFDFSQITASSMLLLMHTRAILRVGALDPRPTWHCPMIPMRHMEGAMVCCAMHWCNVLPDSRVISEGVRAPEHRALMMAGTLDHLLHDGGAAPAGLSSFGVPRPVAVRMPSLVYVAQALPDGYEPAWTPGIIARCPIERIVVVDDPADPDAVRDRMDRISQASVPIALVPA